MLADMMLKSTVYIVTGYTDLRYGIDRLADHIKAKFDLDPFSSAIFLFCGRRRDRIKGLLWEGDGFLLLYKRLNSGSFKWPNNGHEAILLSERQVRWFLDGLEIEQPKAIKPSPRGIYY